MGLRVVYRGVGQHDSSLLQTERFRTAACFFFHVKPFLKSHNYMTPALLSINYTKSVAPQVYVPKPLDRFLFNTALVLKVTNSSYRSNDKS